MTQSGRAGPSELDVVVTGAVVVDPTIGVVKADIGIKDGRVVGVGRAGNRAISNGIELDIGPHTMPISGYGLIATPGAVDSHVHAISPRLLPAALSGGVTTLVTAGFEEPPWAMERTLAGLESWPVNVGLQACARSEDPAELEPLVDAGAIGLKIHEDFGAYPELIDAALTFADARGIAIALHTDGLHESAELEDTVAAIAGRTVHAYHVEGTGGGHLPDLLGLVREAEHRLLVDDADAALRHQRPRRARSDDRDEPRRIDGRARRPRAGAGADPPGDDGRGGTAPRARGDRDRELRFAGDGPDHGVGPANDPARRRDEALAGDRRGAGHPGLPAASADLATTPSGSCATSPRSRSSPRSSTGCRTSSVRCGPGALPTSCSGIRPGSASSRSWC